MKIKFYLGKSYEPAILNRKGTKNFVEGCPQKFKNN